MRILDAGCGEGRNLVYFIRNGFEVWGVDQDATALRMLRLIGKSLHPAFEPDRIIEGDLGKLLFAPESFDAIISSAVLHFAQDTGAFWQMLDELLRVLRPGGVLFIRMTALMGMETLAKPLDNGRYHLPDDSDRFLLTESLLEIMMQRYPLEWIEPFKTVLVAGQRSMSTLVLRKK